LLGESRCALLTVVQSPLRGIQKVPAVGTATGRNRHLCCDVYGPAWVRCGTTETGVAVVPATDGGRTPPASALLAQWREGLQAANYAALTDLYHHEAVLVGSTAAPHVGRDRIREYFESLGPVSKADVDFSQVTSRLVRPDVLLVLALAEFTVDGMPLPMWLTQVWVDDWAGWVIASHHASPVADLRASFPAQQ
jgi:uncharacterized protein (TIGR02246 family)